MNDAVEIAPGVTMAMSVSRAIYRGTAEALSQAGLISTDMLPGQPGNPRGMCCYDPDGSRRSMGNGSTCKPGHKRIVAVRTMGQTFYEVWLLLSPERIQALQEERQQEAGRWPFPQVFGAVPA